MDKLQPLIKHRYWICFGFALIFAVVGWFMANGALAEAIDARSKLVTASFDQAEQGATNPNQNWVEAAKKKNEADAMAYKNAATSLRERQKNARQWPELIREEMQGIAYQDQIKNQLTREKWAANYSDEVEGLLEIVRPYRNGEGLVVVDSNRITHKPYNSWQTRAAQSREVWDAQEDIWLLRSLLNSIASVNGEADRIGEASVREIYRLTLRGGDRNATPAAAGAGGGMAGGMGGLEGTAGMMGGGLAGASSGGAGGSASYPGKDFEGSAGSDILGEEFGADTSAGAAAGGGMGSGKGSMGSMMSAMGGMSEMGAMGVGGGAEAGAAPAEEERYVDKVEDSYKTRGFLLDVRVRDDKLPELLAALTDSDFPVEIVRVEISTEGGAASGGMTGGGLGGSDDLAGGSGLAPGGMAGKSGMSGMSGPPGMGAGRGSGMAPPAMAGGAGGLSSGMGSSMPGKLGAPGGADSGDSSMGGYGGMGGGLSSGGGDPLQNALSDPLLITVKIGGLMTLYQSAQESNAAAATEAAGATEQSNAAPPAITPDPAASPADNPAADTNAAPGVPSEGTAPTEAPPTSTNPENTSSEGRATPGGSSAEAAPSSTADPPQSTDAPATADPSQNPAGNGDLNPPDSPEPGQQPAPGSSDPATPQ